MVLFVKSQILNVTLHWFFNVTFSLETFADTILIVDPLNNYGYMQELTIQTVSFEIV